MTQILKPMLGLFLVASILQLSQGYEVVYENYGVYSVHVDNRAEVEKLQKYQHTTDAILIINGYLKIPDDVYFVVAPHKKTEFEAHMKKVNLNFKILEYDIGQYLSEYAQVQLNCTTDLHNYSWRKYYTLNTTNSWLDSFARLSPEVVRLFKYGTSAEERDLVGVHISRKKNLSRGKLDVMPAYATLRNQLVCYAAMAILGDIYQDIDLDAGLKVPGPPTETEKKKKKGKPVIIVVAGLHGNDWIASATATYLIQSLVTLNTTDLSPLIQDFDWYILPHANPDGYVHTNTTDRLWRKNRNVHEPCFGVDLNQNWGIINSTPEKRKCVNNFGGPFQFSEPETVGLAHLVNTLKPRIKMFVTLHEGHRFTVRTPSGLDAILKIQAAQSSLSLEFRPESDENEFLALESEDSVETYISSTEGIHPVYRIDLAQSEDATPQYPPGVKVPTSQIERVATEAKNIILHLASREIPKSE